MTTTNDLLTRGVENIIPSRAKLESLLESGQKLNIYIGIDPTATRIHIGHAVPLRKLNEFAKLGHHVTFLIGDFTALIGDTSDKDTERPILTTKQIQANFETYKKQAEKVLDFSRVQVAHNSEWLSHLTFVDIVKLSQHFSAGDFTNRELIKKRLEAGKHVGLHELLYPVMQGYDSYYLDTDIQLGGTDQTFNMQAGRTLQRDLRGKESFVIANGFLAGTDGRKMSKSWGNAIWLDDSPDEMYGKVMSLRDDLIMNYFTLATSLDLSEIDKIARELEQGANPMEYKKQLARELVTELHSQSAANQAEATWSQTFQQKEVAEAIVTNIALTTSQLTLFDLLKSLELGVSNSYLKRTVEQGGVEISGTKQTDLTKLLTLQGGEIVKFGKRTFRKISLQPSTIKD
jgi:tyrosyl-tRNA synthetase